MGRERRVNYWGAGRGERGRERGQMIVSGIVMIWLGQCAETPFSLMNTDSVLVMHLSYGC